nr:neurofilament medium polypeptide-like [Rhipicephalus microplus]
MKRALEVEERECLMFEKETVRRTEEAESQERELERLRLQLKIAEIQAGARVSMRDLLHPYKESEEEGPMLNSSDGEQGEDESNRAKENDDGGDEAGDDDEAEEGGVEEEGEEEKPEVQPQAEEEESLQTNPQAEETGSVPVEDTPASPTEEDSSFMHDAPASSPAEESPSSPLEATPSPPTPVDVPASPTEDVVPGASAIESGEDSSAPVSPEEVPADEQSAEVSGEGKNGQENDEKGIADINEGDEEDTQDNASSPKKIESPDAEPEEGLLEDTSNGMEDISEPGSTDGLVDNLEAVVREQEEPWRQESKGSECSVLKERKTKHKKKTCQHRKHRRHRRTNSNNEDREEGELVEERSPSSSSRRRKEVETTVDDLAELAPRINISELPRIPNLKRSEKVASHAAGSESSIGGDRTSATAASHVEVKRTSVLGRVDSGSDISWKKLSKHSQEHSFELKYRKGRDNGNADGLSRGFP